MRDLAAIATFPVFEDTAKIAPLIALLGDVEYLIDNTEHDPSETAM